MNRYQNINDRTWVSVEAHDKSRRKSDVEANKKLSAMFTKNAFADDVPDDIDKHGSISVQHTHVYSVNILENN